MARASAKAEREGFERGPAPRPWVLAQLSYFAWLESRGRPACIFCKSTDPLAPIESGLLYCLRGWVWPGEERACFERGTPWLTTTSPPSP